MTPNLFTYNQTGCMENRYQTIILCKWRYFLYNGDGTSFKQLFETLNTFSKVSGLNLNTNKSTILRVGSLKHTTLTYMPNNKFVWTSTSAKTLKINYYKDTQETLKFNLEPKLNELKIAPTDSVSLEWRHTCHKHNYTKV